MNIAVLSDIHGNHIALKKCLDYLKNKKIATYCFLGDYTGEFRLVILHGENGKWEPDFISLEADTELILQDMKNAGLYEVAPYWTRFTEHIIKGECGDYTHARLLYKAMDICEKKYGECVWPKIPEECYAKAFEDVG